MQASSGDVKSSKIRHIVRLRQMLLRWRAKARMSSSSSSSSSSSPVDVPPGHVAVRVGANRRRFVVRATYLNHPMFRNLLSQAEEEFGFDVQGPITIPCDEALFEDVVRFISRSESGSTVMVNLEDLQRHRRHCHVGLKSGWGGVGEVRPLLADKTVW